MPHALMISTYTSKAEFGGRSDDLLCTINIEWLTTTVEKITLQT